MNIKQETKIATPTQSIVLFLRHLLYKINSIGIINAKGVMINADISL